MCLLDQRGSARDVWSRKACTACVYEPRRVEHRRRTCLGGTDTSRCTIYIYARGGDIRFDLTETLHRATRAEVSHLRCEQERLVNADLVCRNSRRVRTD